MNLQIYPKNHKNYPKITLKKHKNAKNITELFNIYLLLK